MATYHPSTVDMVAAALTPALLSPSEIAPLLAFDLHRTTIRSVLRLLVQQGRAVSEGDIMQMRYRQSDRCHRNLDLVCPPHGCPMREGCARERGWPHAGEVSP